MLFRTKNVLYLPYRGVREDGPKTSKESRPQATSSRTSRPSGNQSHFPLTWRIQESGEKQTGHFRLFSVLLLLFLVWSEGRDRHLGASFRTKSSVPISTCEITPSAADLSASCFRPAFRGLG